MSTIDTLVIGAGHAGLAVSRLLTEAGREHVVLDRGRVAERWRSERWDSLHLLTPRWMTRLPGWRYRGPDQEGFMPVGELVDHLEQLRRRERDPAGPRGRGPPGLAAPRTGTASRPPAAPGRRGTWWSPPARPGGPTCPRAWTGWTRTSSWCPAREYRNPDQLAPGGVLVVGASASGTQIADELVRAGRRVVLAVGRHTRLPRSYRGMDIFWWLEQTGRLARTDGRGRGSASSRRSSSSGAPGRTRAAPTWTWRRCSAAGVELAGRLDRVEGHRVGFRADLPADHVTRADERMFRFLDDRRPLHRRPPAWAAEVEPAAAARRGSPRTGSPTGLDLRAEGIGTVLLATGFRPHHPWLRIPVVGLGRRDPAAPRRDPGSGPLRRRAAVPAPARLDLHRRRPVRGPRRGRPPVLRRQPVAEVLGEAS